MKKLLLIPILALLFFGCCNDDCIGQIPPIPAYVDGACEAVMPNILPLIVVSDNCELSSVVQVPLAGTTINPPLTGEVIATDASGNITRVSFQVTKVDTIAPIITWVGPVADLPDFDTASEHYTKFIAFIKYDVDRIFYIPEFKPYPIDTTVVWYNSIAIR